MTEQEKVFIRNHRNEDVRELMLRYQTAPDFDIHYVAVQIKGWQMAQKKLPTWAATDGIIYPKHLSMEQCSSELTAQYKGEVMARIVKSLMTDNQNECIRFTDLTGGFGVDATMIAKALRTCHTTFVEQNEELCHIARLNFPLLGVTAVDVVCDDCESRLADLPHQHVLFIDPARRDTQGRKTVAIEDCTPDVCELNQLILEKGAVAMVKISPMLDISQARRKMTGVREIHIVGVNGECKEILILLSAFSALDSPLTIHCVNITQEHTDIFAFSPDCEKAAEPQYAHQIGLYLYEPNAAILKAGAFKSVGIEYGVEKLHRHSHLYTSSEKRKNFPGRIFEVVGFFPFNKTGMKNIRERVAKANITVRNFPLSVDELRKRLSIKEGGEDYIFATTLWDVSRVLILCKKADS